jgi:WD40 repeat protein
VLIDPDLGVAHTDEITNVDFNHDGSLLVTGSSDNTLKIWDLASNELALTLPVFTESRVYPTFSPDGRILAVATSEGTTLYDVLGIEAMMTRGSLPDPVREFAFLPRRQTDMPRMIVMSRTDAASSNEPIVSLTLWDLDSFQPLKTIFSKAERGPSPVLCLEGHSQRALIARNDRNLIQLYDIEQAQDHRKALEVNPSSLSFSRNHERLWGVLDNEAVASWSVPHLEIMTKWKDPERERLPSGRTGIACLSAGLQWVVAGSRAFRIYVLHTSDGRLNKVLETSGPVQCVALSPDESLVACGVIKGGVTLFRVATGERIAEISTHQDSVNSVGFSPDGHLLATASRDRTVALWEVDGNSITELLHIASPSGRPVLTVRFSPDGRLLAMLVQDEHAVRLWNLDRLRARFRILGLDWNKADRSESSGS